MGVISTAKAITGSDQSASCARFIQPENCKWMTVIESINSSGWALPPMIIFAGKMHQTSWYKDIPSDLVIGVSENGWTNDQLGLLWVKEIFHKHTHARAIRKYWLLIFDGHGSHVTPEFDQFCTQNMIIPLCMPLHSSHLLQPLDVGCFSSLKKTYGQRVESNMWLGINHIDKRDFLIAYQHARKEALSASNICSGFAATGLVPYQPDQVLSQLHIQMKTPTPPPTSHSNQSVSWVPETSYNIKELELQTQALKHLLKHHSQSPPSPAKQALNQLVKGCQIAMHNAVLLAQENRELQAAN